MMASSPLVLPALLALVACTPERGDVFGEGGQAARPAVAQGWYHDYFTPTYAVCGEPTDYQPYTYLWRTSLSEPEGERLVSDACIDAMFADLKVDWEELGELSEFQWEVYWSVWLSTYALLAWPMGTVDDLRDPVDEETMETILSRLTLYDTSKEPPWVREPLIAELERLSAVTGETRVNALVYNLVMSSFLRTSFLEPEGAPEGALAMIDWDTRTLWFWGGLLYGNMLGTTTLVHEAGHLWLDMPHVACPDLDTTNSVEGLVICDQTWEGAFGYQFGVAWLMAQHHDWDWEDLDDTHDWSWLSDPFEAYLWLILEP